MELSCFLDDTTDVGNLISGSSTFSKTSLNIWKFMVHVLLKPGLENFEHYFTSVRWVQLCGSLSLLCHCLSLGMERKLTFSSPVATVEFSKFAGILSAALSQHQLLRIWNSSTGIPSPPLALSVVMFPKAHLTSHSRISGSLRYFLHSSSVYSCYLFLISSASVKSISFLSFIEPIFAWNVPLVSLIFLKISSLSYSIVFLYFFALITEERFLISPCYSLELYMQMGISFLFTFAFRFSSLHSYL